MSLDGGAIPLLEKEGNIRLIHALRQLVRRSLTARLCQRPRLQNTRLNNNVRKTVLIIASGYSSI
jgi:hypothetical protein